MKVARLFREAIGGPYDRTFAEILFAILDSKGDHVRLAPFQAAFG